MTNTLKMKKMILAGLLLLLLPKTMTAQDFCFDEMTYSPGETTFRLFAPGDAKEVVVRLYEEGTGGVPLKTVTMEPDGTDLWKAVVKGNLQGCFYTFDIGRGETPGVFARAVGVNGQRGAILPPTEEGDNWDTSRPTVKNAADLVVYELHHRDFSIARKDARFPGKYLALTELWAVSHLKELGINAVHLLPSYDFGSIDETRLDTPQYNWGYDPVNYNVPEGSYSTNPYDPACRIREFKQMVKALHQAGIAVILDVVYNHTYDIERSNFQRTYPDYYYRKTADGAYSDGSGCGNETASEQPMMRKFMIESVKYWAKEYHIDGFRFDLMGVHDIETMNEIRKALDEINPNIFIYGEGWSAGPCALPNDRLAMKAHISRMPRIAAFSDELRDALRGPFSDDTKCGWLGAQHLKEGLAEATESMKAGIAGMTAHPQVDYTKVNYAKEPWAAEPTQMMAYVSCHDDMCLTDRLRASIPGITDEELIRLDKLAQTAVFTSQGVPFLLCGEELLRTKKGVHNSYKSPDDINQLDWTNKEKYADVFKYYQRLIELRRLHPAFRLGSTDMVRRHLEFLPAPEGVVVFRLKDHAGGDTWRNIIVALNSSKGVKAVTIPKSSYTVVCDKGGIREQGLGSLGTVSKVAIAPQSALIIHD